jgi:hypothetical protein
MIKSVIPPVIATRFKELKKMTTSSLVGNTNRLLPSSTQHTGRALSSNTVDDHSITNIRVTDTVKGNNGMDMRYTN